MRSSSSSAIINKNQAHLHGEVEVEEQQLQRSQPGAERVGEQAAQRRRVLGAGERRRQAAIAPVGSAARPLRKDNLESACSR